MRPDRYRIPLLGAAILLGATACAASPTPAQRFHSLDSAAHDSMPSQDDYDATFTSLSAACQEPTPQLVTVIQGALAAVESAGITAETNLSVMRHMGALIPAGSGKANCAKVAAVFVSERVHELPR